MVVGAWLNAITDTKRWRREFTLDTYREQRDFIGEMLVSLNALHIVLHHFGIALQGGGGPADLMHREGPATQEWRRMLSLMGTAAQPEVQDAMSAYDRCREQVVLAMNAMNLQAVQAALRETDTAHIAIQAAVKNAQEAMGAMMGRHVHPWRTRVWRKWRNEPLNYL